MAAVVLSAIAFSFEKYIYDKRLINKLLVEVCEQVASDLQWRTPVSATTHLKKWLVTTWPQYDRNVTIIEIYLTLQTCCEFK